VDVSKVDSGNYGPDEECIEEALSASADERLQRLRALLQVGIDQLNRGEGILWTPELSEEIRASARRRAALGEKPDPDVCP
jgi:antitoxin ParD1/3/4